tara:strand:+ start:422 stop:1438 length:1017 start_codon:yes stop_codon:yes gene_type:complete
MSNIIKSLLPKTISGPLSSKEAKSAFESLFRGDSSNAQIAGFLIALRARGESVEEYHAAAKAMRDKATPVIAPPNAIDIVGTGGDGKGTLNISTAAAFVVAGAGIPVAKHGNRNLSSKSGSADVLSELGINIFAETEIVTKALNKIGIAFMMAPLYHPAMAHVMPVRTELGTRTIFNILGPLTNPAKVKRQLTGAFAKNLIRPMAETLKKLGSEKAWLVYGDDGTDEISISGPTSVVQLDNGTIDEFTITPTDAGLKEHDFDLLKGGTPSANARALKDLLNGSESAYRDAVLLNSAAALLVAGSVSSLKDGVKIARESIDSGKAKEKALNLATITSGK